MTLGFGFIGQSNEFGLADHRQLSSPATAPQLARLKYWQANLSSRSDSTGQFVALDFDPAKQDVATGDYDYPPCMGNPLVVPLPYGFGPDVYAGVTISSSLAQDIAVLKLAPVGTSLTSRVVLRYDQYQIAWFQPNAHRSWDTTIARSSAPYTATTDYSGTATACTSSTLVDGSANWATNQWVDRWVVRGTYEGYVTGNTQTTLTVAFWMPYWPSTPPTGAYTIEKRSLTPASLSRTYTDGYIAAAKAADPTLDMRVIDTGIGETDAQDAATAAVAAESMLSLMWWVRRRIVTLGATTLAEARIGFVLGLIKESSFWPYAALVNAAYRKIAECDPYVRVAPVDDIPGGGYDGVSDTIHYTAAGQQAWGRLKGALALEILSLPSGLSRRSLRYFRQCVVVRPLWGIGSTQLRAYSTWPGLGSAGFAERRAPNCYLLRDSEQGSIPLFMSSDGSTIARTGAGGGSLIGFARAALADGMEEAPRSLRAPGARPGANTSSGSTQGGGDVWDVSDDPFPDAWVAFASANQTTQFHFGAGVHRAKVSIPGAGISDREFLQRSFAGDRSLSAQLGITEVVGAIGATWMQHTIGWGDYRRAQTSGGGMIHLPPCVKSTIDGGSLLAEVIPVEGSPDELGGSPADTFNHGGVSADGDAALWPNMRLRQTVTPNWLGIEGCHRVVHRFSSPVTVGGPDTLAWSMRVFLTDNFGTQWAHDPATATDYDGGYVQANNYYWEQTRSARQQFNASGATVGGSLSSWWSRGAGVVGWEAGAGNQSINDGLCVAIYAAFGRTTSKVTIGNELNPAAASDPNFIAVDQLKALFLQQDWLPSSGTTCTTIETAMFLLVGTRAQVKAAAARLYAIGVDSTWTQ